MSQFLIKTLGCKVNQYDSSYLKKLLLKRGWQENQVNPEWLIINTCAVTQTAIRKDRQVWKFLQKKHPQAKIAIFGCWPATYPEAKKLPVDLVWETGNLISLSRHLLNLTKKKSSPLWSVKGLSSSYDLVSNDKARYFLKIADGCNQFCTYCIIPYARGRLSSRLSQEIIKEAKEASKNGWQEIVLCGIHLGRYGQDFKSVKKKVNLVGLLKQLLKEVPGARFRLSSIEINEVDDQLLKLIASSRGRLCRHLHISLQSGSDQILQAMKRPYSVKYFQDRVKKIRQLMPEIALSTDIIVGFPGETAADFKKTYQLAKKIAFSKVHVFPFSAHPKTPAFSLVNQVSAKIKKDRSLELRSLSLDLEAKYQAQIFKKFSQFTVIVEDIQGSVIRSRSEFYFPLSFKITAEEKSKIKVGQLLTISQKQLSS